MRVHRTLLLFNFCGSHKGEYGGVAQLGEHLLCKQGVIGSIPFISTTACGKTYAKRAKAWTKNQICGLIAQQVRAHA